MKLRCLIVDDSPEFLDAARRLLEREGVEVVGATSTGNDAVHLAGTLRPEVTLVDVHLGREDGFDVARRLAAEGASAGTIVLISTHAEEEIEELIEASPAVGFLSKSELSGAAIEEIARHGRNTSH